MSAPLDLWFTDRSRFKLGTARCARARYLGYHAGPTGYGLTARRQSLPLATGISVHRVLEAFARLLQAHDRLPDLAETRGIVADAVSDYELKLDAEGYRGILDSEAARETVREQSTLIAGLAWVLRLNFLPGLLEGYRVVRVEEERLHLLGDDSALMLRTDLLAERRSGHSLAYFECKTTGWESEAWAEQWETDPQLALGTVDAQELWGQEVTETYIIGLNKGRRQRDRYDGDTGDSRKKQLTPLCYGYCKRANPPLANDDWLWAYQWTNDDGETKRATKLHKRRGVWELGESDWPIYAAYRAQDPELTPAEFWVRMMPDSLRRKVCFLLGPMNVQHQQLQSVLRSMAGEEARWQQHLWELYQVQQAGHEWGSPEFQAALDTRIPCSWQCRPFGKDHECEFVPVCHRHTGWDDLATNGRYQARLPHHSPELDQAIARGLLPADAATVDEEDR